MSNKKPIYIEQVGWRYETEHSMLRRCTDHDYTSRCIYMITLTQNDRTKPLLGNLQWSQKSESLQDKPSYQPSTDGKSPELARCVPSELGQRVSEEWCALCQQYPQLRVIRIQIMPEHVHVVLFVTRRIPKHLGKLIGIVKNNCNKHYWQQLTDQGRLGPKGTDTPPPLFSRKFQDTILTHEGQLEIMIRYVEQNPYRALIRRENRDIFKVVTELEVYGTKYAAIGNRWLLERAVRMQVRCHNNNSPENLRLIEKQKEYFLERGRVGGVVVSPCISAGEKEIARAALDEGHPLIVILENGFPPMYKPPGRYFEACAKGLLLMLAPWAYHMEKKTITRSQCLALNDMAYAISSEPWTQELEEAIKSNAGE